MAREVPQYVQQLSMGSMPKVQYSMAQANATQKMSDQLGALGEEIYKKDAEIEKIRSTTMLQTELNRQYQEFGSDPGKLKSAQAAYKTGFIKGIKNPELAAQFEAGYDSIALPYLNKSVETYADNQDKAHKLSIMEGTSAEIASAEAIADGLASNIPEHQEGAAVALTKGMTRIEQYKSAKNHDGSMMFSPAEIMAEEKRIQAAYQKIAEALRVSPVKTAVFDNPGQASLDIASGKYDKVFKDQKEKDKWLKDSQERFESIEKTTKTNQVIKGAMDNDVLYQKVQKGDVSAFDDIESYLAAGGDPVFADTMRDSLLKIRPIPQQQRDETYASIADRVSALQLKKKSNGSYEVRNDDITLEDATRLFNDITKASARGITEVNGYRAQVGNAIVALGKDETGGDDPWEFNMFGVNAEPYDPGYDKIQTFLESQDKDKDYATKAGLLREFVSKADQIPEEIRKDELLFKQAQEKIANFVLAGEAAKGVKNPNVPAIMYLLENPHTSDQYDKMFGTGEAARILGK